MYITAFKLVINFQFMTIVDCNAIRSLCDSNSKMSRKVIDEFLLYYAASRNRLKSLMEHSFASNKHVTNEFDKALVNMLKAQYLAHSIFKNGGNINKLLNHSELQRLRREEKGFS